MVTGKHTVVDDVQDGRFTSVARASNYVYLVWQKRESGGAKVCHGSGVIITS
jgi:hypothetical protein